MTTSPECELLTAQPIIHVDYYTATCRLLHSMAYKSSAKSIVTAENRLRDKLSLHTRLYRTICICQIALHIDP